MTSNKPEKDKELLTDVMKTMFEGALIKKPAGGGKPVQKPQTTNLNNEIQELKNKLEEFQELKNKLEEQKNELDKLKQDLTTKVETVQSEVEVKIVTLTKQNKKRKLEEEGIEKELPERKRAKITYLYPEGVVFKLLYHPKKKPSKWYENISEEAKKRLEKLGGMEFKSLKYLNSKTGEVIIKSLCRTSGCTNLRGGALFCRACKESIINPPTKISEEEKDKEEELNQ